MDAKKSKLIEPEPDVGHHRIAIRGWGMGREAGLGPLTLPPFPPMKNPRIDTQIDGYYTNAKHDLHAAGELRGIQQREQITFDETGRVLR